MYGDARFSFFKGIFQFFKKCVCVIFTAEGKIGEHNEMVFQI